MSLRRRLQKNLTITACRYYFECHVTIFEVLTMMIGKKIIAECRTLAYILHHFDSRCGFLLLSSLPSCHVFARMCSQDAWKGSRIFGISCFIRNTQLPGKKGQLIKILIAELSRTLRRRTVEIDESGDVRFPPIRVSR